MRDDMRRDYDAFIGHQRVVQYETNYSGLSYSSWKGTLETPRPICYKNACIGYRECTHHASNTFDMDEALGCARVKVQYGDDDQNIEVKQVISWSESCYKGPSPGNDSKSCRCMLFHALSTAYIGSMRISFFLFDSLYILIFFFFLVSAN